MHHIFFSLQLVDTLLASSSWLIVNSAGVNTGEQVSP